MRGWQRGLRPGRNIFFSFGTLSICSPIQNEAFPSHRCKMVPFFMQVQLKRLGSLGVSTLSCRSIAVRGDFFLSLYGNKNTFFNSNTRYACY